MGNSPAAKRTCAPGSWYEVFHVVLRIYRDGVRFPREAGNMAAKCSVHKLVADVAALNGGKVLLVRYRDASKYDNQRGWFLPDDYLLHGEHPAEAARRILKEQAGVAIPLPPLTHIESFGNGAWHLVFHHKADLSKAPRLKAGANVADAEWFPLDALPDREEVSHGGWAIDVLREIFGGRN